MTKKSPEKMFSIKDSDDLESNKNAENIKMEDNTDSSKKEEDIENKLESNDFTLKSFKDQIKKSNVNIDDKTINNYYNQIIDNKKYIEKYNTDIKELEKVKKEHNAKVEENKNSPELSKISKQISELENKLADLNVEKQIKEDDIKGIINNIYNTENKTETVENISKIENKNRQNSNFESRNNLLNLTLNSNIKTDNIIKKDDNIKNEEKEFLGEKDETIFPPKQASSKKGDDNIILDINNQEQDFLGEKKENLPTKQEQDFLGEKDRKSPFESIEKKGEGEETPKEAENNTSGINEMLKKISDDMAKGFESVLGAISSKGETKQENKQEQIKSQEDRKEGVGKPSSYEDKPERKQQNYIDDYRKSLRSNAPLDGMVGIKGLELKVNNIGSYI